MKEFVEYIVKNLVDQPDQVKVECLDNNGTLVMEIAVAKEDVGKLVGREGKTIKALRLVTSLVGIKVDRRVNLVVLD